MKRRIPHIVHRRLLFPAGRTQKVADFISILDYFPFHAPSLILREDLSFPVVVAHLYHFSKLCIFTSLGLLTGIFMSCTESEMYDVFWNPNRASQDFDQSQAFAEQHTVSAGGSFRPISIGELLTMLQWRSLKSAGTHTPRPNHRCTKCQGDKIGSKSR